MKKYRFFYHYNKRQDKITVHFKGVCHIVKDIECLAPNGSKWNNTQPRLVMQGWASSVDIKQNKAYIK